MELFSVLRTASALAVGAEVAIVEGTVPGGGRAPAIMGSGLSPGLL